MTFYEEIIGHHISPDTAAVLDSLCEFVALYTAAYPDVLESSIWECIANVILRMLHPTH